VAIRQGRARSRGRAEALLDHAADHATVQALEAQALERALLGGEALARHRARDRDQSIERRPRSIDRPLS
jgi:hypothetical protein